MSIQQAYANINPDNLGNNNCYGKENCDIYLNGSVDGKGMPTRPHRMPAYCRYITISFKQPASNIHITISNGTSIIDSDYIQAVSTGEYTTFNIAGYESGIYNVTVFSNDIILAQKNIEIE